MKIQATKHALKRLEEIGLDIDYAMKALNKIKKPSKLPKYLKSGKYFKYGVVNRFIYYRGSGLLFTIANDTNPRTLVTVTKVG